MLQKIKQFLKRYKDNFFVKSVLKTKRAIEERKASRRLKRIKQIHLDKNKKVKVLFIIVDKNTWNKVKALYLAMLESDKIDVKIVCCPEPFKKDTGTTFDYFVQQGYDCIDARVGVGPWNAIKNQGKWFDIKILEPDYIFYTEPYNLYLPPKYRSNITSSYTKVCNIPYGSTITENFLKIRPHNFYCDVYLCYTNNEDEKNYNIAQFQKQHDLGLQQTKYLGFLAGADILKQKNVESSAWNFSKNKTRGIWTPRWTLDEKLGGSNFFRYRDVLFSYAKEHQDVDFLFRPHPMALDNFLRTGKMTQQEVNDFINQCNDADNISLDTQAEYMSNFWHSSFLVTDVSSIIVEYFMTGKPILYCKTERDEKTYLPFFTKILNACYVVNNEKELLSALDYLKTGQDEKKHLREELIKEIFGTDIVNVPIAIVNDLLKDAYRDCYEK